MAYADFLTALMAFFLVMWIVNSVSADERSELAAYFGGDVARPQATSLPAALGEREAGTLSRDLADAIAGGHVTIERLDDAIRLEIVDRLGDPLFDNGTGTFNATGDRLMEAVGKAIASTSAPFSIEGHTDAFPSAVAGRSNWELSSDRANAARRALVAAGVDPHRVRAVSGLAATRPLNAGEPHLSANRRISIILTMKARSE